MNMTWINRSVYTLLERIGDFQIFFLSACKWLSAICFLLALGFTCVEIFLNLSDARKELTRLMVTVVSYFIMLFFFPIAMKNLLSFAMNMGYGAVFSTGLYEAEVSETSGALHASEADFYKWLDKESGGIFTTSTSTDGSKIALEFNIVDDKTGYVDLNKTFTYILAFVKIAWKCFPKITLFKATFTAIGVGFIYFFAILIVIVCFFVVLINYIMALIDYFALMGFGILMIPLSLWKGTKSYTANVLNSIGHILIKLIVISAMMFLSIMCIVDIFTQIYMHSLIVAGVSLAVEIDDLLMMAVSLLFQGPLLAVITMQTEKIASFICGAPPKLSFGDFALGAAQTAGMAMAAGTGTMGSAKAMGTVSSSVASGIVGGMASKAMGGGAKSVAKSAMASSANTIGSELKGSLSDVGGKMAEGVNNFAKMSGMSRSLGGRNLVPPSSGGGSSSASFSSGGGSSSTSSGGEAPRPYTGEEGVYGNAKGDSVLDKVTRASNRLSKGGMASRIMGGHLGEVAAIGNAIKRTHAEHKDDKKEGNGYAKNIIKDVASSRLAASANPHGGSRVSFASDGGKLSGQSAEVRYRGAGRKDMDVMDGLKGTSKFQVLGDDNFYSALQSQNEGDSMGENQGDSRKSENDENSVDEKNKGELEDAENESR